MSVVQIELKNNLSFFQLPSQQYHNLFLEIGKCAEKCLAAAAEHGEVIIITNSDEGWVNYSAERYLPYMLPVLKKYRVVSARTRYEKFYPNQPLCWKAAAFAHEVNEHFCTLDEALLDRECSNVTNETDVPDVDMISTDDSSLEDSVSSSPGGWSAEGEVKSVATVVYRKEIISFGDSIEERTAVKIVSDQLDATPKSVMFLSNPTPTQIIGQLTMLTRHMSFVCDHAADLDLEISQKQAEKCAQGYLAKKVSHFPERQQSGSTESSSSSSNFFRRILQVGSNCKAESNGHRDIDEFDC